VISAAKIVIVMARVYRSRSLVNRRGTFLRSAHVPGERLVRGGITKRDQPALRDARSRPASKFCSLILVIAQSRPIRRLYCGEQAGFNIGLDFHKFLSFSKLLFEMWRWSTRLRLRCWRSLPLARRRSDYSKPISPALTPLLTFQAASCCLVMVVSSLNGGEASF